MLSDAAFNDPAMSGQTDYERRDHDFYATPQENVDCLHLFEPLDGTIWWEPACGEGHISKRVEQLTGEDVYSTDLIDRGYGMGGIDFLQVEKIVLDGTVGTVFQMKDGQKLYFAKQIRGIITNPPFDDLAELFIRHAIELMRPVNGKIIMFLRNEFDCGKTRRGLFNRLNWFTPEGSLVSFPKFPFAHKIVVTKRPRWIEGSTGSPRHSYAWFVWDFAHEGGAYVSYVHPDDCPTLRNK
jgi:hypothetical protein